MKILQLSMSDRAGGAERVAIDLHRGFLDRGHDARLLVRFRKTDASGVLELDAYDGGMPWSGLCRRLEGWLRRRHGLLGRFRLREALRDLALPRRGLDRWRGLEDFNYPASGRLLDDSAWTPDVIHAHNLHRDYFDLRALSFLSWRRPFAWTLHDTWPLTGHCGYFIDCERWRQGCGGCPDLRRYPAVRVDRTRENLARKSRIYASSRLAIATPSHWLMKCVAGSALRPWRDRIIPYGVDLTVYTPADKAGVRQRLGLPADSFVCLYSTVSGASHANPYKDFGTVERAVRLLRGLMGDRLLLVCLGGTARPPAGGVVQAGTIREPATVARYYQAADVLLHAATADNFPCAVLEALACGTPAIATGVGGIPEQIEDGVTGCLVPRGDWEAMAAFVQALAAQPQRVAEMGRRAADCAQARYDVARQVSDYVLWFEELRQASDERT